MEQGLAGEQIQWNQHPKSMAWMTSVVVFSSAGTVPWTSGGTVVYNKPMPFARETASARFWTLNLL